jgi:hypothetical protein
MMPPSGSFLAEKCAESGGFFESELLDVSQKKKLIN